MKQIICLSHTPWRTRPSRTQQLLTRLTDAQVLFFEPPPRDREQSHQDGLRVRSNVMLYSLPAPLSGGKDQTLLRRRSQTRVADFIQRLMDRHRFREPILWCTTPEGAFLIDQLAYRCLVYDCHREWDELPLEWESELAIAADVVFAASEGLVRRLSPCNDNIALLPNGANPLMFLRGDLTPPACLQGLARPILARVGDVTADLELEPIRFAAQWRPQWTFLFIGRVTKRAAQALSPLPNVAFTGAVPAVDLPDYLSACQALFDLVNIRRRGSDIVPSRIYEYLSTGKPTLTMAAPGQGHPFPDVIYSASDSSEFLRCCQQAVDERDALLCQRRLTYAQDASWSNRAREVSRILDLL